MLIIIFTARHHAKWSAGPSNAIQKMHQGLVPRIGGLAIMCGLWFTVLIIGPLQVAPLVLATTIASSVIFAIGFAEDLTSQVGVLWRLALTFIPGLALAYYCGLSVSHLGLPLVDTLLAYPWVALLFTAFALAGVTHAFNLIDGLNGLASYTALWILAAYGFLGYLYADHLIVQLSLLLFTPVLGFWLFNWPWGKCFLGDGGAYLLGFYLAWLGVVLTRSHEAISPFAPLLICGYPIIEALYSIARRTSKGANSGIPDSEHLHQLVKIGLVRPWLKDHQHGSIRPNSVAGLLVSLISLPFIALAVIFNTQQGLLIALFLLELALYVWLYQFIKAKIAAQTGLEDTGSKKTGLEQTGSDKTGSEEFRCNKIEHRHQIN